MTLDPFSPLFGATVLALVAVELCWRRWRGRDYDLRALAASFGVSIGQAVSNAAGAVVIGGAFLLAARLAPVQLPADDWRTWCFGFLAVEFAYYWQHRMLHQMRWFWATHAVHHSSSDMVLPAALRLGWTGWVTGTFLPLLGPVLIGIPPLVVATLVVFNLRYQFFLHTEAVGRLGPLEWVFNTPAHHRAHHGAEGAYLNCNFGGVLIVFDRLFGTLRTDPEKDPARYGRCEPVSSNNPIHIAFHEWIAIVRDLRAAPDLRTRLAILFRPAPMEVDAAVAAIHPRPVDQTA